MSLKCRSVISGLLLITACSDGPPHGTHKGDAIVASFYDAGQKYEVIASGHEVELEKLEGDERRVKVPFLQCNLVGEWKKDEGQWQNLEAEQGSVCVLPGELLERPHTTVTVSDGDVAGYGDGIYLTVDGELHVEGKKVGRWSFDLDAHQ